MKLVLRASIEADLVGLGKQVIRAFIESKGWKIARGGMRGNPINSYYTCKVFKGEEDPSEEPYSSYCMFVINSEGIFYNTSGGTLLQEKCLNKNLKSKVKKLKETYDTIRALESW